MILDELSAISPVDGRYRRQTLALAPFFSEFGLIRYRVRVEIEYLLALSAIGNGGPDLTGLQQHVAALRNIWKEFSADDARRIKEIEKTTNHDVKAVEYFIKEKLETLDLGWAREWVHFGLTSQDINNTAIPLSIREALEQVLVPSFSELYQTIEERAAQWKDVAMLARTHGQPASPTRLGKEIMVFVERLKAQLAQLGNIPMSAKFGGATGNFNSHHVTFPMVDWVAFSNRFVEEQLGLSRSRITTQIEHYDNLAALCDVFRRINTILIDFSRDIWAYVSMEYFRQQVKAGEVGSSAMPHKVNPIDFENAEGNLGVANALFEHLSAKLPVSRLQRDLTDSTVLRNIGVPFAHTLIAVKSLMRGIGKLLLNEDALYRDLEANWAVVAEALQSILRREGFANPYETLKDLTRTGKPINQHAIEEFIKNLHVSDAIKAEMLQVTPFNYLGVNTMES